MRAFLPLHRGAALLIVGLVLGLSGRGLSQTAPPAPTKVEEWQTTDLSLLDLVTDGYELVSVISPSSYTRIYFLTKPGKIAKCREETNPTNLPLPPPPPSAPGQAESFIPPPSRPGQIGTFQPPPPVIPGKANAAGPSPSDNIVTSVQTEFECAELSKILRK
jgi:hypothetical protein